MITLDLRRAIARAAARFGPEIPGLKLRPAGEPGRYATSVAFGLAVASGNSAEEIARAIAGQLSDESFIAHATVTGDGFVTIKVTDAALAAVTARVITAGPACVRSGILNGVTVPEPPPADWAHAATWEQARAALAAQLAPRLASAAGATVAEGTATPVLHAKRPPASRSLPPRLAEVPPIGPAGLDGKGGADASPGGPVAEAIAYAGADAVRFALARAVPGRPVRIDPASVARHVPGNPAYAVRYAHARAASGLRWAAALGASGEAVQPCLPADPADWALLDALSWLPERVVTAARRGRPDEFARYLEDLAGATIAAVPFVTSKRSVTNKHGVTHKESAGHGHNAGREHAAGDGGSAGPGDSERLALTRDLAAAARTGLAAGLGLLGIAAAEHL